MAGTWLDAARWWLVFYVLLSGPAMLSFWLPVHGWRTTWVRVGGHWGYLAGLGAYVSVGAGAAAWRAELLRVEFGGSWSRLVPGVLLSLAAFALRRSWAKRLPVLALLGVPELFPARAHTPLVQTGAYALVRHPRYLDLLLSVLGMALVADYLAGYVAWGICVLLVALVVPLEERELRLRFGEEFAEYRRRVPALIPRGLSS